MSQEIKDIIMNVASDKNADALQAFHTAITNKVSAALDAKRIEVAQSMIQRHKDVVGNENN